LGGGGGGGAARGISVDRLLSTGGGWLGIGGGALEVDGTGGGMVGGASIVGDLTEFESKLDSRAWDSSAFLCGTDAGMSVS